ncbi:Aldo/keto reductase [Pustulibacterium marinum]|uniref:Aldo/keto reductase n=1 Tax=Pustulibacterium marinum TaxID=1224947 RepID=A0A1I7HGR1_9FLAO|nr:aldo/keto reductase [Pustulibacterium marinum]SFU59905.1 Aldo/keto reductase [Pustulibacterium marinum]
MIDKITLNDGNKIPQLGFGTYKAAEQEGIDSVKFALQNGYRLLDTAAIYGNEVAVGKGIVESEIPRNEIFLTTKLHRENLGYESAKKAFAESLEKLKLDYVDLYLIHWPANTKNYDNWQKANSETWRAMEELQSEGKIKSIGVSNFRKKHLDALLEKAKVVPAVNQIEFHPGYWQPEVTKLCNDLSILVEAWSPLAKGKIFHNEILRSIAEKYGKTVSQVTLRWIIELGAVPIPKSTTSERILENLEVFDFKLLPEDVSIICELPVMGFSGELPNEWPDVVKVDH